MWASSFSSALPYMNVILNLEALHHVEGEFCPLRRALDDEKIISFTEPKYVTNKHGSINAVFVPRGYH